MKFSNSIVVGGPIAVGKSTLVGSLPFIPVQELNSNDELQKLLLEKMYAGDVNASHFFQLDMLLTRFDKYKNLSNNENMHVFDRMIFEDYFFAKTILEKHPNVWQYYKSIWEDKVYQTINEIGIPKLYILLICKWSTFKERVFNRNKEIEIKNFDANQKYFKSMLETYEAQMLQMFKKYNLPFIVVQTDDMDQLEVIEYVKNELKAKGIL